jgi:hypothetical protein
MADEKTNQRIVLSRHTLGIYERMGPGAAKVEDTLILLRDEVAILRAIVIEHPEKALAIGDLVRRWEALADRLREKAN